MAQRPQEDNVIYANFGARKRVARPEETGPSVEEAGARRPHTQAANRVLNAALLRTDVGRARRGTDYADGDHVIELTPRASGVDASVAGSQNEPFAVALNLPRRSTEELSRAVNALAAEAGSVDKALRGDVSDVVLDVLLAASPEEYRFYCTCPDSAPVCKHAVAVAEKTAELIDADPTVIFTIRGISSVTLQQSVRAQKDEVVKENAAEGSEFFWSGRDLPDLPQPKVAPMIEDSDIEMLHRAMQTISFTNIDQLRAVADIEDLYDELTRS